MRVIIKNYDSTKANTKSIDNKKKTLRKLNWF